MIPNSARSEQERAQPVSMEALVRQFRTPPREYGPIDCWWWEAGHLDREKMRWQLEEMNDKGVAGTWFYPRFVSGEPMASDPPYWTDEWWDFTRFSIEEQRRLGMVSWLNDWTARQFFQDRLRAEREGNPSLAGRRLALHAQESKAPGLITMDIPPEEEVLSAAAYRKVDGQLDQASREGLGDSAMDHRLAWEAKAAGWLVTVVTGQPHDLDYLHPFVADRWLELLLGAYEEKLGDLVGTTLKAYGTDEVFVLNGNMLWAPSLFDRFRTEKGYDPSPYLVGLFHDIGRMTDKIRCDYYDIMVSMVEESLYARLSRRLTERGMLFTEFCPNGKSEDMLSQTYNYGDFFRYMSNYTIPGNEENKGRTRTFQAKLASSIADLYGRDRVGVCAYWGSGWGHTTEENLAWTHENYALGVNLYNRHGVLFSTMGGWYEWVPPEVHFRQPYWQYWKHFTDYVTRLSYLLSQGVHQPDVAVLYPLTTIHAHWSGGRLSPEGTRQKFRHPEDFGDAAHEAARTTYEVAKRVYRGGIDLDFVDDRSLCRAQVDEGQLKVAGMAFRAVVLPPMTTIRTETLEQVKSLYDSGGTVVAFRRLPHASPEQGRDDPNIRALLKEIFGVASSDGVTGLVQRQGQQGGKAFFLPDGDASIPALLSDAIAQDVVASEKEVFHTHRKIGDVDVYFLFNAREEKRDISFALRASGEPEIWNAFTGETTPHHRFEAVDEGRTKVCLDMEPNEGVLLVLVPSRGRPQVREDDLTMLTSLESHRDHLDVRGFCDAGGKKTVRVIYEHEEFSSHTIVDEPEAPISLDGRWNVRLEPTMDNRWGDFRYPASEERIGAEARRFLYMEEEGKAGAELGWHEPDFDDSSCEQVTYSYGPYWWTIGPFDEGTEPEEILEKARAGEIEIDEPYEVEGKSFHWQRYSFSEKFGHEGKEAHNTFGGGLRGVSERFLVFEAANDGRDTTRYLITYVYSPEEEDFLLNFGGAAEFPRQAWINGNRVISSPSSQEADAEATVRLGEGWNSILLKLVQPKGEGIATFAVLHRPASPPLSDPLVPLLRWFIEPKRLLFDLTPEKERRVGWYRFSAPPGLSSMRLNLKARAVTAWIDGQPVDVEGKEEIVLEAPRKDTSQIALRVKQEPGCYAGAAFVLPVAFTCEEGRMPLGDWCQYGLANYSGAVQYTKLLKLEKPHLAGKVVLDLGRVSTTAEVHVNGKLAGVGMARPFRFDVTELVEEGENEIEVKVVNTLANHMSTYPTNYVYEGQTVSGLLGPVKLQFLSQAAFSIES